jgi:cobalt-zinc-cadmium resistance protein CzcA
MVYSANSLSAVRWSIVLWMRGLPQYIGCWFYCALGIAVLNGIVLIEHFKELNIKE